MSKNSSCVALFVCLEMLPLAAAAAPYGDNVAKRARIVQSHSSLIPEICGIISTYCGVRDIAVCHVHFGYVYSDFSTMLRFTSSPHVNRRQICSLEQTANKDTFYSMPLDPLEGRCRNLRDWCPTRDGLLLLYVPVSSSSLSDIGDRLNVVAVTPLVTHIADKEQLTIATRDIPGPVVSNDGRQLVSLIPGSRADSPVTRIADKEQLTIATRDIPGAVLSNDGRQLVSLIPGSRADSLVAVAVADDTRVADVYPTRLSVYWHDCTTATWNPIHDHPYAAQPQHMLIMGTDLYAFIELVDIDTASIATASRYLYAWRYSLAVKEEDKREWKKVTEHKCSKDADRSWQSSWQSIVAISATKFWFICAADPPMMDPVDEFDIETSTMTRLSWRPPNSEMSVREVYYDAVNDMVYSIGKYARIWVRKRLIGPWYQLSVTGEWVAREDQ